VSDVLDEFRKYGYCLYGADHRSASAKFTEMNGQPRSDGAWILKAVH